MAQDEGQNASSGIKVFLIAYSRLLRETVARLLQKMVCEHSTD
jgi:hypothetical protein